MPKARWTATQVRNSARWADEQAMLASSKRDTVAWRRAAIQLWKKANEIEKDNRNGRAVAERATALGKNGKVASEVGKDCRALQAQPSHIC